MPHWRVNFRPESYGAELIPSLAQCERLVEQCQVRLRGWYYPHLSRRDSERARDKNWIAGWSGFRGNVEYWRFYQSGQFLHLFAIYEASVQEFHEQLKATTRSHLGRREFEGFDWDSVPGFISITNFIYTVTEIFEFASRLSAKNVYPTKLAISVSLERIKGFVLTTDFDRAWYNLYQASGDSLGHTWTFSAQELTTSSAEKALQTACWFFERFGWLNPPIETLRQDQEKFLSKKS